MTIRARLFVAIATAFAAAPAFADNNAGVPKAAGTNGASNSAPAKVPATPAAPAAAPRNNRPANTPAPANMQPNSGGSNGASNGANTAAPAGTPAPTNSNAKPGSFQDPANQHASNQDAQDQKNRRRSTHIFVPGYGYTNWYGNWNYPYWDNSAYTNGSGDTTASTPAAATGGPSSSGADAARATMTDEQRRLRKEMEATPDYQQAAREVREAQAAYDAALQNARRQLKDSPEYRDARAQKQQAARQVEAVQAAHQQSPSAATQPTSQPFPPQLVQAAQAKLDAAAQVTDLETEMAEKDSQVTAARQQLATATEKLNNLKMQHDAAVVSDPKWQNAKEKLNANRP